ncbi:hypothetical protein M8542_19350 [Amycolatopsis sp. OK19-0408]|uniref:DUF4383 domain-containing protein n=1 Tax=Amycolatopsis iheyensis TaxID=2945988 RepID=A0A9X2SLV4_9PSEU|nr:hypothetical protein [Amycolatopsis iheyensis]MCR6484990.1 hypothetical protein [Amycolatopsis iheyensis]
MTTLLADGTRLAAPEKWLARYVLALLALVQAGLGFGALFLPADPHADMAGMPGMAGMTHPAQPSFAGVSWNLALGAGLLVVALYPRLAGLWLPVYCGLTVVLGVASVSDLVRGLPVTGRIATHVLSVVGVALLLVVYRRRKPRAGREPRPAAALRRR